MNNEKRSEGKYALIALGVVFPFYLLVKASAGAETAFIALVAIIMMLSAAYGFWHERRSLWFWATLGLLAALHAILVISVPWSRFQLTLWTASGFILGDFLTVSAVMLLVHRLVTRKARS